MQIGSRLGSESAEFGRSPVLNTERSPKATARSRDMTYGFRAQMGAPEGREEGASLSCWYCQSSFFALPSSLTLEGVSIGLSLGWLHLRAPWHL